MNDGLGGTTVADVGEVTYQLQHRTFGRWYFGRDLGGDIAVAAIELANARALAEGLDTGVQYRVVKQERQVLSW